MRTDFRDRSHLKSVRGERPADLPRAGKRKSIEEDEQITCWQCLEDTGIETSAIVEITVAPRRTPNGKATGGTKAHVCAHCLARGKITKLIG